MGMQGGKEWGKGRAVRGRVRMRSSLLEHRLGTRRGRDVELRTEFCEGERVLANVIAAVGTPCREHFIDG
jgi:hypothetical protein